MIDEKLDAAVRSATDLADPEAEWTRAEVARRLLNTTAAPSKIGRFTVVRFVGAGAMGRVFLAYDEKLDRRVAIKLLARHTSAHARERLLREARALAKLSHPNVVQVYEVGTHHDAPFIAMEFLSGSTFRAWQVDAKPGPGQVLQAYVQAGQGLAAAHRAGLVHRDFKPDNAFVDDVEGALRVRVIDFGLALRDAASEEPSSTDDVRLTRTATLLGTPLYMAPEQLRGDAATPASDQFAFCVSLAEALSGTHPFPADSLDALRDAQQRPPRLTKDLPSHVRAALLRGMTTDPAQRFGSVEVLLDALQADVARTRRRWLGVGGLLAAAATAGVLANRHEPPSPCTGAEQALADVWSQPRRDALVAGFDALSSVHAPATGRRLATALDQFSHAWVGQHEDACLDTNVRHEQSADMLDRRMTCLDQTRVAFDSVVRVLEGQPAEVLDHADDLLATLPDPAACADLAALAERAPPATATQRAGLQRVRALTSEAQALLLAGSSASLDRARDAMSVADDLALPRAQAEAGLAVGRALADRGDLEPALEVLARAHQRAVAVGDDDLARDLVSQRHHIESTRGNVDIAAALEPALVGGSVSEEDIADTALLRATRGVHAGEFEAARALFEQARRGFEPLGKPLDVALALRGIAHCNALLGSFDEAITDARAGLATVRSVVGDTHPRVAREQLYLADILRMAGRYPEALEHARAAVQMSIEIRGAEHMDVADARRTLGGLLLEAGHYDEALETLQAATAGLQATRGPDDTETAAAHGDLAIVLDVLGRTEEAAVQMRRSLEIRERVHGADHPATARARDNYGALLSGLGRHETAEREIRAALQARIAAYGERHPEVAASYGNLGAAFEMRGDFAAAEPEYARAEALSVATEGEDHPNAATFKTNRAKALLQLDRPAPAVPLLRSALKTRQAALPPGNLYTLDTRTALGIALCRTEQPVEGREHLQASIALGEQHETPPEERLYAAMALADCARLHDDRPGERDALAQARRIAGDDPTMLQTLHDRDG